MMLYLTKIKRKIIEQATVILFVLIVLVFSLLSPQFFTFANLVNILIQASSLAIVASGITLVLLTAGIDLSVGSIMFVAGVISGKLAVTGSPVWLVALLVMMTGLVFGLLNALFIGRFKVVPFIATLATLYIGRGFGLYLSDTRAINLPEAFLQIGSARILGIPFPIVVMVLVVGIVHLLLSRSVWGRQIYAVGHSKEKAVKAGLPVEKLLLSVYLISGLCAAIGGLVAMAQLGAVSPTFGWQTEFTAIAAAVLGGTSLFGGRGNVFPGTVIGAVTIQALQSGLVIVNADPYFYPLITGSVIFLIVLIDSIRNREQLKRRRRVA
jgi:ribose transport system permease protein